MAAAALSLPLALLLAPALCLAFNATADVGNEYAPSSDVSEDRYKLPVGFFMGAASAAFQIEGAWNVSGRGECTWDHYFHYLHPELDNGDVADDSYDKYPEDVTLAKNIKMNAYRFSISWSRILPDGTINNINQDGIDYYNNLIDTLISNSITPVVTMYHWDLPQALQDSLNGWNGNATIQDLFVDYADLLFKTYGDRVQWWIPFNEILSFCTTYNDGLLQENGYESGVSEYRCSHNAILAHAKTYQLYYDKYSLQGGQIGMAIVASYYTPLQAGNADDEDAAERKLEFEYGWYADPLMFGDYPESMRTRIDANSKLEGRAESRLPTFTDDEKKILKGTLDFFGVNHYTTSYATTSSSYCSSTSSGAYADDSGVTTSVDPAWKLGTNWSTRTPWGFRALLNWVKDRYSNLPCLITENGYNGNTEEGLNDFNRVSFLSTYLRALLTATNEDYVNVMGYLTWSLLDNLEWVQGFKQRFGIHYVDFDDPDRKRIPKKSATFLKDTIRSQKVVYYGYGYMS